MSTRRFSASRAVLRLLAFIALILTAAACGDDTAGTSFKVQKGDGNTVDYGGDGSVIITDDGDYIFTGTPGEDCVQIGDDCVVIDDNGHYCNEEGAQVDIVVIDGEVAEVICYPSDEGGTPVEEVTNSDGTVEVPQTENGSVIVFDESTDGTPIVGNVVLDAERTTLYGNGVDKTIIDGNVEITSNNSRVRGVTIYGNLHIKQTSNNAAVAFCKVYGNLHIESNDVTAVDCEVYGNIHVTGNNTTLLRNGTAADWDITGGNPICQANFAFTDEDEDHILDDGERGDDLSCP